MNLFNASSWSINIKIFGIMLMAFVTVTLINTPLAIQTFTDVNRQVVRQVVTETALRQKDAIAEDFSTALEIFELFPEQRIAYLAVTQWLTRSDPSTENFEVEATQAKASADRVIRAEILEEAPSLFNQAWLIDTNGQVITNISNIDEPQYDVSVGDYVNVSDSPAHRAGQLLGQTTTSTQNVDLVVEEFEDHLSIQLLSAILLSDGTFVGTLVIELNDNLITNNLILTNDNNNTYSFVASPNNSSQFITLETTNPNLINLNTQATRSRINIQDAQFYISGNRSVIGYYTPIFENFRSDTLLIVELDEATALQNIASSIVATSGPAILLELSLLVIGVFIINYIFVRPINIITDTIRATNAGDLTSPFPINTSDDEIGELAESVIELRQQIHTLTQDMTNRVESRARDLQITQEIARVAITEDDINQLMSRVVNLIIDRFDSIYHAQIFLIEGNYAVLKASTNEVGQQLLARGHRLGIGSLSVIGQVTQQNQTIIARDTASSEIHRRNEFLRETRTELAIPLRLGNRVIGALDVQSTMRDAFNEDMVAILETMTAQIAIALENTRLYDESTRRLQELDNSARQRIQNNWQDFMYSQRTQKLTSHAGSQVTFDFTALRERATQTGEIVIGERTERQTIPIAIPIIIRGQTLGVVEWELTETDYNQNRILLAQELANRLAVSLDNARLVQVGQQTAENERVINTISAKISGQTDIEQILQTAIQEVGQALHAPHVNINLRQLKNNGNSQQPTDKQSE